MKYWEIVADGLTRRGWSWGCSAAATEDGALHIVDAHRDDGHRFVIRSDAKLTAFLELERTISSETSPSAPVTYRQSRRNH